MEPTQGWAGRLGDVAPATPGTAAPLRPGDPGALGPYTVLGRLGSGGMGTVYLGQGPGGEAVAVKVIRADLAADAAFLTRFRWEVEAARRVPPFCTARVLGADLDGALPYLVTEYVPGPRLDQAVVRDGPLPASSLTGFAVGIAAALTAIHSVGVVHRDLKPGNVLLSPYGPRVIDFGIARALDAAAALTATGAAVGTPGWMSPEQLTGERVTPAADVFLWGALVAYAGTGRAPFGTGPPQALAERIRSASPDLDGLEAPLRRMVATALDRDPARRPSAKGLLLALLGGEAPADQHEAVTQVLQRTWVREEPHADTLLAAPGHVPRPESHPVGGGGPRSAGPHVDGAPGGRVDGARGWPPPAGPRWPAPARAGAGGGARPRRRWYRRKRVWVLAGLVLLLGAGAQAGRQPVTGAQPGATPAASAAAEAEPDAQRPAAPAPTPAPAAPAPVADLDRPLRDGSLEFVVSGLSCEREAIGEGAFARAAQGRFCTLTLRVTNVGDAAATLHAGNQVLLDGAGREYRADGGAPWLVPGELGWWTDINPGNAVNGTLTYDVPDGVQPVQVRLHDSPFSGGVVATL